MNIKPKPGQTIAYKAEHIWRGIWRVKWTNSLNYPNTFHTLFRLIDGQWMSGENAPTGVYNGGLPRVASKAVSDLLNSKFNQAQTNTTL